jgi:hypothetical protein
MRVVIFKSKSDPKVLAFTQDPNGGNLPADYAPWAPIGGSAARATDNLSGGMSDPIVADILRDGYHLWSRA